MRRRNIKVKDCALTGSGGLLILLAFLMMNPLVSSAWAVGGSDTENNPPSFDDTEEKNDAITSTVEIGFAPSSGSTNLSPTTSAGQSAQVNVLATVSVENSGGYSVYVKSNTQNLVGQVSSANVIPGISGNVTYDKLSTNTWGYYAGEGTAVPEGALYKAVSVTGNGDKVAENTSGKIISDMKQIMLSFAAKIGNDKPADTYQNTVTMSVVSSPLEITGLTSLTTMQEMTSEVCAASVTGDSEQLKDVRDGKYYWVAKLADGNCWMTQNLDLDLGTGGLSATTSDISSDWNQSSTHKPVATIKDLTGGTTSSVGTYSWDLGVLISTKPEASTGCGNITANLSSSCPGQFRNVSSLKASSDPDFYQTNNASYTTTEYDAHYLVGNLYQWNAATAGTGEVLNTNASGSVCPKGWKLPTSNNTDNGSFAYFVTKVGASNTTTIVKPPFYFVRSGLVNKANSRMEYAGADGYYWSSTAGTVNQVYRMKVGVAGDSVNPSFAENRYVALSVRCIAR